VSAVCQNVFSNYDTDIFRKFIDFMADMAKVAYGDSEESDVALRVIADHARAAAFMIADGILPSNEGRGYILRRLIRRAYRFGRSIGMQEPFLYKVAQEVVRTMNGAYPELLEVRDFMARVITEEEERFAGTLEKGLVLLEEEMKKTKDQGSPVISGEVAFKLYDTYGFPLDIVNDISEKNGLSVDESGFNELMSQQRERAKAAWKGAEQDSLFASLMSAAGSDELRVEFVGYAHLKSQGRISFLLDINGKPVKELVEGETGWLVSTSTPFYGESGGQVGDKGRISSQTGQAKVEDTRKPHSEIIVHHVKVTRGNLKQDQEISLKVDDGKRVSIARNHTATHLLHSALRRVLGEHVRQAGSLVEENRLRFDFTHIKSLSKEELSKIEDDVNAAILSDISVQTMEMDHEHAVEKGALALFGEKYSDKVRVVSLGDVSMELCGGTHLESTGQAGSFCILSEGAVASGVRRIEAVTGWEALRFWQKNRLKLESLQDMFKVGTDQVVDRIIALQSQIKELSKENKTLKQKLSSGTGKQLASESRDISGIQVIAQKVDDTDMNGLRKLMDDIRSKMKSGIAMLASVDKDKPSLLIYVSKDLHEKFTAPQLIKEVAAEIKGSGGGRPDLAQAGGSDPKGLDKALLKLEEILSKS
ncbi:MAG: alanine--tRNA ligase, partial [Desulfonatronovibrio sp.]